MSKGDTMHNNDDCDEQFCIECYDECLVCAAFVHKNDGTTNAYGSFKCFDCLASGSYR